MGEQLLMRRPQNGLYAPAKTPRMALARLTEAPSQVLSAPDKYPQSAPKAAERGWAKNWDARTRMIDNSFLNFGTNTQAGNNPGAAPSSDTKWF